MAHELRPYQREAVDGLYAYWLEGGGNGLIVVPTGGGKSLINATIVRELLGEYPDMRIGCVTHVKELIKQNAQELISEWNQAPVGIYSAGLNRRDIRSKILFMGIQSVWNKLDIIGKLDLVIVDEAHLIPRDAATRYGRFFAAARKATPDMRIIGLTATPFRLDSGRLDRGDDRLFDDVVYDCEVRKLIDGGYLSPLISTATLAQVDTSGVHTRSGEFVEKELARAALNIVDAACAEIVERAADRIGMLLFCVNVEHAQKVVLAMRGLGVSCDLVVGSTPSGERASIIRRFGAKQLRCLVSVGVLTTGFNVPHVDCVALLRPTKSAGLYVQMVGRGFRRAPGKDNCLVLDFGGNIDRHGPIDAVTPKAIGKKGERDEALDREERPTEKICPACGQEQPIQVRECGFCGHEFPTLGLVHDATAAQAAILSTEVIPPREVRVTDVRYRVHEKAGGLPSLKVEFFSGLDIYRSFLCFNHQGFPRRQAASYWHLAGGEHPYPATVMEAAERAPNELREPSAIFVKKSGKWWDVVSHRWD